MSDQSRLEVSLRNIAHKSIVDPYSLCGELVGRSLMIVEGLPSTGKTSISNFVLSEWGKHSTLSYFDTTDARVQQPLLYYKSGGELSKVYARQFGAMKEWGIDKAALNVLDFLVQTKLYNTNQRFIFDRSYLTVMAYMGEWLDLHGNSDKVEKFGDYCDKLNTVIVYVYAPTKSIMERQRLNKDSLLQFTREEIDLLQLTYLRSLMRVKSALGRTKIILLENVEKDPSWLHIF